MINDVPVYSWCENIEDGAMVQIEGLTHLPFLFNHVAIMPDCHQGFGMPIGGVLATDGAIIPNAVGVDIGCGMQAVKTNLNVESLHRDFLEKLASGIREVVPTGFQKHKSPKKVSKLPDMANFGFRTKNSPFVVENELKNARLQLGTLGGGNHFIEIQADQDGLVWLMIHSGSRNVGLQVAKHYHNEAVQARINAGDMIEKDLAHLKIDSELAIDYLAEMHWCVDFAKRNRSFMMNRVQWQLNNLINCDFNEPIDIAHNFSALECHFDREVWVHRKGATRAIEGELGIIPGSQGTKSYIVRGKGSENSFTSCSHGAGRLISRNAAQKKLDLHEEQAAMDSQGIVHGLNHIKDLDEASGAYKNIDLVMNAQSDLVDIVWELRPLAVIKG